MKKKPGLHSHEGVVDEGPRPGSFQHVVQVVLQFAVTRVPAATLRSVRQRFTEQTEPSPAHPTRSFYAAYRLATALDILRTVVLGPVTR